MSNQVPGLYVQASVQELHGLTSAPELVSAISAAREYPGGINDQYVQTIKPPVSAGVAVAMLYKICEPPEGSTLVSRSDTGITGRVTVKVAPWPFPSLAA